VKNVVDGAFMNALVIGGGMSPEKSPAVAEAEASPSFSNSGLQLSNSGSLSRQDPSGALTTSGSLSRPKISPFKALSAEAEDSYVVVNPAQVEVNAIADVLGKSPQITSPPATRKPMTMPSIPTGGMLAYPQSQPLSIFSPASISPPLGHGFPSNSPPFPTPSPSSSPTVGSALSRALASTAAKFMWPSSTPEEQSARDILANLSSLSKSASSDDERAIWDKITTSARRAYVIVDLAQHRLTTRQANEAEDDVTYSGYVLYLKALSIIRVAMMQAKSFWQLKDQTITSSINQVVQFLREQFNEYLDNADKLNAKLKRTKYQALISSNRIFVDQAKLIFDRARELGKEAAIEEVVGYAAISERYYTNALLLFKTLIARDLPEAEVLSENDRRIVETYASSILRRMQQLQKKLPPTSPSSRSGSGSPPF